MKLLSAIGFFALTAPVFATTYHFTASQNGRKIGTASYTATSRKNFLTETLMLKVTIPRGVEQVTQVQSFKKDGTPIGEGVTVKMGGKVTGIGIVKFIGRKAILSTFIRGKKVSQTLVASGSLPIKDPSNVWFKTIFPKIGTSVTVMNFSLETRSWTKETTTFVKNEVVYVGKRAYHCHLIRSENASMHSTMDLDGNGDMIGANLDGIKLKLTS